jgi:hypothetical protein
VLSVAVPPCTMLEVRVESDGAFRHGFAATDNTFVYVIEGGRDRARR